MGTMHLDIAKIKKFLRTIFVPCIFLTMPWVGLKRESVAFPVHTHLLFAVSNETLCFPSM